MKRKSIEVIREALGEASVLFMSQECKGTEIVMPTEELSRIADEANKRIIQTIRKEVEGKVYTAKFGWKQQPTGMKYMQSPDAERRIVDWDDILTLLTTLEKEVLE